MAAIGGLLLSAALLGLLLGLIKPSLVIWWGANKTRARVLLTYGLIFVVGAGFAIAGAPSDLEAGKTALEAKNYKEAIARLEAVPLNDAGYSEAQRLLPEVKKNFLFSTLDAAEAASLAGDHAKVVALLTDYPSEGPGSLDAAKILAESEEAIANAKQERTIQEQQQAAQKQAEKEQREVQDKAQEAAQAQERLMADFPKCESEEAQTEVAGALENAPLGRVYGLSLIKIKDAKQVAGSAASRSCTGTASLNNAQSYLMTYRFYRDGTDIMIEAEVLGLDG
jgi:hypothetical protein